MSSGVRIQRKEFVNEVKSHPIKVADAVADTRLTGVDVGAADLNGDGVIKGKREAGALFDEIDKVDNDGKKKSIDITGTDGKATAAAEKLAAVGDLAKAGKLQKKARTAEKSNDDVLFVGMRSETKTEATALQKRGDKAGFNVQFIGSDSKTVESGGKDHDLSDRKGIDAFVKTLGLPKTQSKLVADAIEGAPASGRNELAEIAKVWAKAEQGGDIPNRLIISGHHVFEFFGDHGDLGESNLWALARAMPKAAAQIEDVHLAGCYSLGRDTVHEWKDAFPGLETLWAYDETAPGANSGAKGAEATWDSATRGPIGILKREQAKDTRHGDQVIVWSRTGGYEDNKPTPKKQDLLDNVAKYTDAYKKGFSGDQVYGNHDSDLRSYYNALRDLAESPDISADDKALLKDRASQTIRLLYYGSVSGDWAKANDKLLDSAYATAGMTKPNFAKLDRKAALAEIDKFLNATSKSTDPDVKKAREQMIGLRDLDQKVLKNEWIH